VSARVCVYVRVRVRECVANVVYVFKKCNKHAHAQVSVHVHHADVRTY